MVGFTDFNRIPGFARLLQPMIARELEAGVEDTYKRMIRNWEQGQDITGKSWEPLAPETVARKGHSIPLIETRQMIDSAGYEVNNDELEAEIYIDSEYGYIHEAGAPSQGIPPRPILQPTLGYFSDNSKPVIGKAIDASFKSAGAAGIALHFAGNVKGGR